MTGITLPEEILSVWCRQIYTLSLHDALPIYFAENGKQDDIAAYFDQGFKSVNDAGINDLHIHMKS